MRTLAAILFLACTAMPAHAVVIHVKADGSGDVPTIAAAYAIAQSGDDIVLGSGTYHEHDIVMKSLVDLMSESGNPEDTIVDAQGLGRCLVGPGVTGAPDIRGITFQNGVHAVEGGILLAGQGGTGGGHNADYSDCIFRNGSAPNGGAVVTRAGNGSAPQFVHCVFESNEATAGDGGAVWTRGVGTFSVCSFRQNQATGRGGAVYAEKSFDVWGPGFQGTLFEENAASGEGGAVYSTGPGFLYGTRLTYCRFEENSAAKGGAARLNEFDFVKNSTFIHNVAAQDGGALLLVSIEPDKDNLGNYADNVFAQNQAGASGGAIHETGSLFWLVRCTFAANTAPSGGHLWTSGSPTIRSSILAFAKSGAATAGTATPATSCTDVYGNIGGDYVGPLVNEDHDPTNLSANPRFCDLAGLDLTLREDSPCLPPLPPTCESGGVARIGALGLGCAAVNAPPSFDNSSWGRIKSAYR